MRQLYYDCAARTPRIFDEGLAGFVSGMAHPDRGHLLVLILPARQVTERLETLALHGPTALGLLGTRYTANAHAYAPTRFALGHPLVTWFAGQILWLSLDDHPAEDLQHNLPRVSMPESIATHVLHHVPEVRRIEACFTTSQIVGRQDGAALDEACTAQPGDQVVTLD